MRCFQCGGSGQITSVVGGNLFRCPMCSGAGVARREPLWKTDVVEAARILLAKAKNSEQITINAGATIEHGFGVHHGRLCCDEYELIKLICDHVEKSQR